MENKILLIGNFHNFHYEIIETAIVKYYDILEIKEDPSIIIYLHINNNLSFKQYISDKYPKINIGNIKKYDYFINCTIYDAYYNKLNKCPTYKYISHEVTDRLRLHPNVYFLTDLSKSRFISADILPYSEYKKISSIPIYVIQGNLNQGRRNLKLLIKLFQSTYIYKFIIKLIGRGSLPKELEEYKDKIVLKNNLDFIDYHKEFVDAYCILPLISKKTHSQYYTMKLTSSINYAKGYKLKCLIDKDLQDIYNLQDTEVYNDINDISVAFNKTLEEFYNNNSIVKEREK